MIQKIIKNSRILSKSSNLSTFNKCTSQYLNNRCLSTLKNSSKSQYSTNYNWLLYTSLLVAGFSTFNYQKSSIELEHKKPNYEDKNIPVSERMSEYVKNLQNQICEELSKIDGKEFIRDSWTRKLGGEGISCVLQDGNVFEKAGVNISIVHGKLPLPAIKQMRANASEQLKGPGPYNFFTASLSLVLHPHNPFAPTVHLNYRYFEIIDPENPENKVWWFGGGSDLTPSYLIEEDAKHFHKTLKEACDKHDPTFYTDFKKWCDKYFYNTHRSEARGIGGIFFDDLDSKDPEQLFKFVRECGDSFLPSYVPILKKRINTPFTKEQKEWQQMRRGRYVEFNLIHDRGTKFGLATPNPRIESILVSLPKTASWAYNYQPEPNSPEAKLVDVLKNPKEWI